MVSSHFDMTTKAGTVGGTFLTVVGNIHQDDLLKTVVLAAIGAVVSFGVTVLLKVIVGFLKK